MKTYPPVLSELNTLRRVAAGESIARFGDGEFNLCRGGRAKAQRSDDRLQWRLQAILKDSGRCLVGIPNLRSETPKGSFWEKYQSASGLLAPREYVSSFITRPDSAPWIDTDEYWELLEALWVGQDVTLVHGGRHGLTEADLVGARRVREVAGPEVDAWECYDELLDRILEHEPKRVLLCLGPAATVMADDLCARGVHAIDLGHIGMFLRKHRRGEPLVVTDEDRAA